MTRWRWARARAASSWLLSEMSLQQHIYDSLVHARTPDVVLDVAGTWRARYKLHRIVLIQSVRPPPPAHRAHAHISLQGFFSSLFTAGFLESGLQHVDIVFDDRNITRPGTSSISHSFHATHHPSSAFEYVRPLHSQPHLTVTLGYASRASTAAVPRSMFPLPSFPAHTIPSPLPFPAPPHPQISRAATTPRRPPSFSPSSQPPSTSPSPLSHPKPSLASSTPSGPIQSSTTSNLPLVLPSTFLQNKTPTPPSAWSTSQRSSSPRPHLPPRTPTMSWLTNCTISTCKRRTLQNPTLNQNPQVVRDSLLPSITAPCQTRWARPPHVGSHAGAQTCFYTRKDSPV